MDTPARGLDAQNLLDAWPGYVLLIDEDHTILEANRATVEAFGLPREGLLGQYCPRAIHGLDAPYPGCPLEEAREVGGAVEREFYDSDRGRWLKSGVYPTGQVSPAGKRVYLHVVTDVTHEHERVAEQQRSADRQATLNDLLRLATETAPAEDVLARMLQRLLAVEWLSIERKGAIFLSDPGGGDLVLAAHHALAAPILETCARVAADHCLCGQAAFTCQTVFADRVDERHAVTYAGMEPHGHFCLPIQRAGRVLGVLNLYVSEGYVRATADETFLVAATDVIAAFLTQRESHEILEVAVARLRRIVGGTIDVLSNAVESRDGYTAGHQRRVSDLARAVATEMGLSADSVEGIRVAAMLHDLGKLAIPAEILATSRRLSEVERALVQSHSEVGYQIIRPVDFPWPVGDAVHQHHERLDGSGYPLGLSGDAICLGARVIGVCDVVEAMASHRPWRPALGVPAALAEIRQRRATAYDPVVVDACVRVFELNHFELKS